MAGEQTGNAVVGAALPTSVPLVAAAPTGPIRLGSGRYLPYQATTQWRPWPAVGTVVLICAVTVAIALGGSLVMSLASSNPAKITGALLLPMFVAQIAMVVGALMAARARGDALAPALALKAPAGGLKTYIIALLVLLASVGTFTLGSSYLLEHDATSDLKGMADVFRGPWWPLALVVIGIGAPLSEELLFRGFLQTALVPTSLGYWGASVITTAIWTAMHAGYSWVGLAEVFLIGLVFCLILRRTGSLRVTIAGHAIYNTLIALVVIFAPKDWLGF